jgi:hypothetical protein
MVTSPTCCPPPANSVGVGVTGSNLFRVRPIRMGLPSDSSGKAVPGSATRTVQDKVPLIHEGLQVILDSVPACVGDAGSLRDRDPPMFALQLPFPHPFSFNSCGAVMHHLSIQF